MPGFRPHAWVVHQLNPMNDPERRSEASSSTDDQPETHQERLTTDHSSRTQRIRNDEAIIEDSFDDGSLIRDTEAGGQSSSQEQHQLEQDVDGVEEENEEEDLRPQDEMIMVHSVHVPILTHATPSVFATIGTAWQPIMARGRETRENDSSSLRSYSPPRSSEEYLRRSGGNSKSDSESRTLRMRRRHAARTARGAPAAAYVHEAHAAAGTSQEAETAAYPDEIREPDAPRRDVQAKAQADAPRAFNRPQRRPTTESLASLATDCSIKCHSIEFRSEDPEYLSSDDDGSGHYPSSEVMDLRPSADPNVHRMDTCSLVSFSSCVSANSAMVTDLHQVGSGGYRNRNSDWELQAEGGNAPRERSIGHGKLILDNLPSHWDQAFDGEESDFVGRGSGLVGSSGEGGGGNKVNPLGESELAYSTLLTLLGRDSSHAQGDNDGNGNKTYKRRTSVDSVATGMSGIWSAMARIPDEMDSHSESSGSATSNKSSESMKAKKRRRHFARMCARAMVGLMALAALSGSVLYIVEDEKSFADLRLFERLFGSSSKEQQAESHDDKSHKNARDLLRHHRRRKNLEHQQKLLRARKERLLRHGKGGVDGARRRAMLQEGQGLGYYRQDDIPIYQDNHPYAQQGNDPSLQRVYYGQEDNPLHPDNRLFDQQASAEEENYHRRALGQEGYLAPQEIPPSNREEASWHTNEHSSVENRDFVVWNDHEELNFDY